MKFSRYTFSIVSAALLGVTLLFFRLPVSHLLNSVLVKPLFDDFEGGFWTDAILACSLLVVACWTAKEQPRIFLYRLTLYGLTFFVFQRTNNYWTFTHLHIFQQFAYWDLCALSLVIILPLSYLLQKKERDDDREESNKGFIEDNAVTCLEEDHYRRRVTAVEIADLIRLTRNLRLGSCLHEPPPPWFVSSRTT